MEDYEVIEQIGRGAFGAAFLVLHKTENKKYVLKKIRLSKQCEKFKKAAHHEMELIAKLRHPYIVEYKDSWVEKESYICIVTHYCERGDISNVIREARGAYFAEERICKWMTQLLLAIDYLHSNRVLHRDLKLSNIFITKENDVRLGDFGLAKLLDGEALASSVIGTPNYMCPEQLSNIPYGYKSDIWSLGCCMFEIAAHHQAFRAPDMAGLMNKINRSLISPMPIVYSSTLKQIIKTMLRKSPEHRPTAAELLRHPHLQPFLLKCHNPSTVFLPVKSPSPTNTKEKIRRSSSPKSLGGKKYHVERESKLKQRELLPLFDENVHVEYPNLLNNEPLTKEKLETKRVDPTSFSGQVSHDSEDSKSGDTSLEMTAQFEESIGALDSLNLQSNALSEEHKEIAKSENGIMKGDKTINPEPVSNADIIKEREVHAKDGKFDRMSMPNGVFGLKVLSFLEDNGIFTKDIMLSKVDMEPRSSTVTVENSGAVSGSPCAAGIENPGTCPKEDVREVDPSSNSSPVEKNGIQVKNEESHDDRSTSPPNLQRADALESLLELCARLMKQDKFDELKGVLKPFGDDIVSSRETAIWLTKSLMNNAQKFAKES